MKILFSKEKSIIQALIFIFFPFPLPEAIVRVERNKKYVKKWYRIYIHTQRDRLTDRQMFGKTDGRQGNRLPVHLGA